MKKKSIIREVQDRLTEKLKIGQSKHDAKKTKTSTEGIYSYSTYDNYLQVCCQFSRWAKETHECRNLDQAQDHAGEYLQKRIDDGLSAWTIKRDAAALAKLYDCKNQDFGVNLPERKRVDVVRSRTEKSNSKFSEKLNKDLVDFCKASGLRRQEAQKVKPSDVYQKDGKTYINVYKSKGGKSRIIEAINDQPYQISQKAFFDGRDRVFQAVRSHADIHSYRADFATELYKKIARDPVGIPQAERYFCRGDLAGVWYDKKAMLLVSQAMGHERLSVIAQSYLRPNKI